MLNQSMRSKYLPWFDMEVKLLINVNERHISIRKWLTWLQVSALCAGVCACDVTRCPCWMLMCTNTALESKPCKMATSPPCLGRQLQSCWWVMTSLTNVFAKVWLAASGKRHTGRRHHINIPTSHRSWAEMIGDFKGSSCWVDKGLPAFCRGALESCKW